MANITTEALPASLKMRQAFNEKEIRAEIKDAFRESLKNLTPAERELAENIAFLISTKQTYGMLFLSLRRNLISMCSLINDQLTNSRDQKEKIKIVAELLDMDRVRRMCGVSLAEIRTGRANFDHKPYPIALEYLSDHDVILPVVNMPKEIKGFLSIKMEKGSSEDYLSYIKAKADRVAFINFNNNVYFNNYEVGGLSEPISRTIIINPISFIGDAEEVQMPSWLLAASIVHEAAHIEWDSRVGAKYKGPEDNDKSERYAYIRKVQFLERLIEEAPSLGLGDVKKKIIMANINKIYEELQKMNVSLGYESDDFSVKF